MVIVILIRQTVLKHGLNSMQSGNAVHVHRYQRRLVRYLFFMLFSDLLQNCLYIKLSLAILDVFICILI